MTSYKNLEAWKKSIFLVTQVYNLSKVFPKEEIYGITSQIKRAAVSIPANIAEGCGRHYRRDTKHFFHIARGSLYELETLLDISVQINFLKKDDFEMLTPLMDENLRILNGLLKRHEKEDLR